ncbi:MAG: TlpA family protein disulfide reductase [Candidatus Acidiferrales bacterium]
MKRKVVTGLVLTGIAAMLTLFVWPDYRQGEPSPAGKKARDFSFELGGKPETLAALHGKIVVLNFWATWCPPCVEEAPSLNRLQERIASRGATILGVSVDDDGDAYRQFLSLHQVNFPTFRDPTKKIANEYGTFVYPETYIIDRQGHILRKIVGEQDWDSPEMMAYFDSLLTGKNQSASN